MNRIKKQEYRCAYKEVITILNVIDSRLKRLIPKEKIEFYERNLDETHEFEYDYSKSIREQKLLYPTRCIISNLFKNYIAVERDRKEIIEKEKIEFRKIEEVKRKLFSTYNIF